MLIPLRALVFGAPFCLAAVGAYLVTGPSPPAFDIELLAVTPEPAPTATLSVKWTPSAEDEAAGSLDAAFRIVRIAVSGSDEVLFPPEKSDVRRLSLHPDRPVEITVPLHRVPGADEVRVTLLVFPGASKVYLDEIANRQTVAPGGIAPHARFGLTVRAGPWGLVVLPE